jgi:hypothetical protein
MSRGRPKEEVVERPRKYTRVFEGKDCTTTWHYDLDVALSPVRVDVKWHKSMAQMKAEIKEEQQIRKRARQQKQINERNEANKTVSKSNKQQSKHTSSRGRGK